MNLPELCIRRPVMTSLLTAALCLFGAMAFRLLPVSDLPTVDFPTIVVGASLPGATPETMASAVATVLEQQFSTIAGVDSMTSTSGTGGTSITLQFTLDRNIDAAAQDVQAAIAAVQRRLPADMPNPPSLRKTNPADQPVLYLALYSPTLPLSIVDEYAETMMSQRISSVDGVSQVQVYGAQKYALRVRLDPRLLASRGITLDEVRSALSAHNVNQPTGLLDGYRQSVQILASGQLANAAEFTGIVVAYRNGAPVRLGELAEVIDGVQDTRVANWYGERTAGKTLDAARSIVLAVQKQPGVNTVEVVSRVRALLPIFAKQLPESVHLSILRDNSEAVRASVHDVEFTMMLSIALVVLVIFIFLRSAWATIIPSVAIPMALLGTFVAMYFFGYSLDNLSLLALTLSVGFVVDDAIVMLENIVRHIEAGEGAYQAAIAGAKEIGFTIVSMTLSLSAVFIPVLFMGGVLGRLFHEFAVTIGVAILISGFISLTLTPMLGSRLLRSAASHASADKPRGLADRAFDAVLGFYERGLRWSLRHPLSVLALSVVTLGATFALFQRIPKGLFPSEDVGNLFIATETAQGTSFEEMVRHQRAVAAIVGQDPNVEGYMSSCGARGAGGVNTGVVFVHLKPRAQRALGVDDIISELRPKLAKVPGIRTYLQNPPTVRLGGMLSKSQYQFTLQGTDTVELYRVAAALEAKLHGVADLRDVTSDLQLKNPQIDVLIDRDRAASFGVSAFQIEATLYDAYASRQISTIYSTNNTYQVILELLPEAARNPDSLSKLYVRANDGKVVPLDAVARLRPSVGPLTVNHLGQRPAVTVSFNLRQGASLGNAIAAVNELARTTVPATVSSTFLGTAQAFESSQAGLGALLLLAILVIYMVLGILYESFIHPVTILSALPFAGFGALATLALFREDLSIYAFVGVIMLVGLVKKNGIMMIDFALEAQRKEGKNAEQAIYEACKVRFRPITMTTMAALAGTLPIALGLGAGAESRRPLGLAVVGGLLFSQLLTLYVTPVFFLVMDRLFARRGAAAPQDHTEQTPPVVVRDAAKSHSDAAQ
jgi:HAE1 family hydrophobic/amphiphilic exporter-1